MRCPEGYVCTAGGCATRGDVAACAGLAEGTTCQAASGVTGTCTGGACQTGLCGNGDVDVGELCDDGNQTSGDGCRADCAKIEVCGDGELDANEQCDDGNQNAADGCDACKEVAWNARTVVGSPTVATQSALAEPHGVAVDGFGRIYIADTENHRIQRVELDGSVTTLAGTGAPGFSGDGGEATSAQLFSPGGVGVDGLGRVFVADTENHRIRRIDLDGTIATIAGTGRPAFEGDDGAAILASFREPQGVAVDGQGRVLIADTENHRIRQIDTDGTINTIAGTGVAAFGGDGGPATSARLNSPYTIALDATGNVLIADSLNRRIRRVDPAGTITTIAGGGAGPIGDGGPATAATLEIPVGMAIDGMGRVVITDALGNRIRRFTIGGTIQTIAGDGTSGFGGDGAAATTAKVANPFGVAVDGMSRIVIADTSNQRIRRIDALGMIGTVAGNGTFGFGGDGGLATSAQLSSPFGLATDPMGRIYIADSLNHRIRRIELDGTITTVAGSGRIGFGGDGGPATAALLNLPNGVVVDAQGRVLVADTANHRIRRVALDGTISTIVGTGTAGFEGDGGPATSARIQNPNGLTFDSTGRLLFADTYNLRIRRIELDGTITTVAGTGGFGYNGDGMQATAATLAFPYEIAIDAQDRIVIGDSGNHRVRRVALDGTISTVAGSGVAGTAGDGGPATAAQLNGPHGIAIDAQGRIAFADEFNSRIRRVEIDGTLSTLVGSTAGNSGDAAAATAARITSPLGIVLDSAGRYVFTDTNNHRIRRFTAGGTIETIAGKIDPDNIGPVANARLADPQAIVLGSSFALVAGGTSGTLELVRDGRVSAVAGRYPQSSATGALARYRTGDFGNVGGVALDASAGIVYITETTSHRLHAITMTDPAQPSTWTIMTLANTAGTAGFADGAAATARFRGPTGLFLDGKTLYIADTGNHAIRALDLDAQTVTTIANVDHRLGFAGDGGPAAAALLFRPSAITRCTNGDLFVADTGNNRVRRIAAITKVISTVLGDGVPASSGEGDPAFTFPVDAPRGLACDGFGNLFVSSSTTLRLLPATDQGLVDGNGPVQTIYGAPPRDKFPASVTSCLTGVAVVSPTIVQIADACTGLLVELVLAAPTT